MADYYPLLARALDALPDRSPALRRAVYDRARSALIAQLRSLDPPVPEADIDLERQAIARAYGLEVRSIQEHTHLSYHVPLGSYAEMAAAIDAGGGSPLGPVTLEHRYLLEDVPYGLVFYEALAAIAGVAVPNISASITLFSTVSGHDFRNENLLLRELALDRLSPSGLLARCTGG